MDTERFDGLTRPLSATPSRRSVLALASALLGRAAIGVPAGVEAKKQKKAIPNQFGCLNVGQKCRGNHALCCSGVCAGKKPKKGEKDKRRCAAHNTGGCTPERSVCVTSNAVLSVCPTPPDETSLCFATTGNAGFCGSLFLFDTPVNCQPCAKDSDCSAIGFPPGSACVFFQGGECGDTCAVTDGRACLAPGAVD